MNDPSQRLLGEIRALTQFVARSDLGPVVELAADQKLIQIAIDADHSAKSQILRRWLSRLRAAELVMHRRSRDGDVRLNLRGLLHDRAIVVHTTYHRKTETEPIEVIVDLIEAVDPDELLRTLSEHETHAGPPVRTHPTTG